MSDRPGGEPTEEPTPRKLQQAREKGQIAKSADLTSALAFAAAAGALLAGGGWLVGECARLMQTGLTRAVTGTPDAALAAASLSTASSDVLRLSLPVLVPAFVAAALVGYLQAGGLFTLKPLVPDGSRLDPIAGLGRMFSAQTAFELGKSLIKVAVVFAVAWATLAPLVPEVTRLAADRPDAGFAWATLVSGKLLLRVVVAFAVIGAADYLWQRRRHLAQLRMTREEVKREHKESEGDPHHKAERQRLHRELSQHQMIEAVRSADCVVVNPDHLAVALRFDEATMGAPEVVAKGERLVAQQIKEVARQYGVPIYRDVPLARALARLEPGDEIPEELYDAVAEVLRFLGRGQTTEETR